MDMLFKINEIRAPSSGFTKLFMKCSWINISKVSKRENEHNCEKYRELSEGTDKTFKKTSYKRENPYPQITSSLN